MPTISPWFRLVRARTLIAVLGALALAMSAAVATAPTAHASTPTLTLSVSSGVSGSGVKVGGAGFKRSSVVTVTMAGQPVKAFRTDRRGSFSTRVRVPQLPPGGTTIRAAAARKDVTVRFNVLATAPTLARTIAPAPGVVLSEAFDGPDGTFVSSTDFWNSSDQGLSRNATWFSESGAMQRVANAGRTTSDYFRMWTRQNDLSHVKAELDVRFNGFVSGTSGWHGINLWLHKQMCTPVPSCSAVNDPNNKGGNSGYALDFMNRDGSLTILKKVPGDTRGTWPTGNVGYVEGGTYYLLAQTTFRPNPGQTYRFAGTSIDNGDGTSTLQVIIDGQVRLQVRDNGSIGGPRLGAGRVGLRSDFADMNADNLTITR